MDNLQRIEQQAKQAFQKGDYTGAIRLFEQALSLAQSIPRPDVLHVAQLLNNVGFMHQNLRDFPSAQTYYEKALAIYRTHNHGESVEFAIALHNTGRVAYVQRKPEIAWDYWTQELAMWKRLNNPGCTHYLASCLQACGEIMADSGEYIGARRNFEQALELRQIVLPPTHADIADNLLLLARLCEAQEDRQAARTYYQKALPLFTSGLGNNHPVVKDIENSLKRLA